MLLGPLTANRHRSCIQLSAIRPRGHDAGAERDIHRYATVRDDPGHLFLISSSFCWSSVGFPETGCGPGPGAGRPLF